jgi:hypothetical protein
MSADLPNALRVEEYRALRATIRERGSMRLFVIPLTFVAWAAILLAVLAAGPAPGLALLPLLALAAGFESAFSLHVGVERIGRYLEHRYEVAPDGPGWEHLTAALARQPALAAGIDPLFTRLFAVAVLATVGLVLSIAGPWPAGVWDRAARAAELGTAAAFLSRQFAARRFTRAQRERDLAVIAEAPLPRRGV